MGELKRKDNSLCFRKNGKNIYIPIENTREIYCLAEITINTKVLDFLSSNGVVLHFFNYYEGYSGTYYPRERYNSGRLLIKQVHAFKEKRIDIAVNIVKGIAKNIDDTLYHYYRHGSEDIKPTIDWIRNDFLEVIDGLNCINQVLKIEGELWERFYRNFKYILPEDFVLNKRVKRPPDNPINAMISFGNMILYGKTITAIYNTHLDNRISFLHEPTERRFSLSLDISEAFKPIVVFKTIFELVNNNKIKVNKHFEKDLNYCLLNEEGKQIFIKAIENRLESKFEHKRLKRKVTYKTAIKLDCYKLIKDILEDKEFKPFSFKEKI